MKTKTIYLRTTDRNKLVRQEAVAGRLSPEATQVFRGLIVNVGESKTSRKPIKKGRLRRFNDADYRKSTGGEFVDLWETDVPEPLGDRDFHKALNRRAETHGDVECTNNPDNTEEFLIKTDCGDGVKSIAILTEIDQQLTNVEAARKSIRGLSLKYALAQLRRLVIT